MNPNPLDVLVASSRMIWTFFSGKVLIWLITWRILSSVVRASNPRKIRAKTQHSRTFRKLQQNSKMQKHTRVFRKLIGQKLLHKKYQLALMAENPHGTITLRNSCNFLPYLWKRKFTCITWCFISSIVDLLLCDYYCQLTVAGIGADLIKSVPFLFPLGLWKTKHNALHPHHTKLAIHHLDFVQSPDLSVGQPFFPSLSIYKVQNQICSDTSSLTSLCKKKSHFCLLNISTAINMHKANNFVPLSLSLGFTKLTTVFLFSKLQSYFIL